MKSDEFLIGYFKLNNHVLIAIESDHTCTRCVLNINLDNGIYGIECQGSSETLCEEVLCKRLTTLLIVDNDPDISLISFRELTSASHYIVKLLDKLNKGYGSNT